MPILEASRAAEVYSGLSERGIRLVVCDGVFDMLHPGHLGHLRQAKALGDTLLVLVATDRYGSKGPGHPQFPERERAEMVASIREVDCAVIVDSTEDILDLIRAWKPRYYCKGPDYKAHRPVALVKVMELVASLSGETVFTEGKPYSSRALADGMPAKAQAFLEDFCRRWPLAEALRQVEAVRGLKTLVMGEAIEDVYIKVRPKGMSPKGAAVVYSPDGMESFVGGASIVAWHLTALCPNTVTLGCPIDAIKKTRYVVEPFWQKAFILEQSPGRDPTKGWPLAALPSRDLVVAADFGHGAFTAGEAAEIAQGSRCFALTVQSNALNWGFNPVSRWPRCDYLVADEMEYRLALQDRESPVEALLERLGARMGVKMAAMTLGHEGCLVASSAGIFRVPALAQKVVDTTGAGDAFLAVSAPFFSMGLHPEFVAFMGSVAAAVHVGRLGNPPLSKEDIIEALERLLSRE